MTPSLPHKVTIGTGDWRIRPTVVLTTWDQFSMGPSEVADQSSSAISPPSSPALARKPGRMTSVVTLCRDLTPRTVLAGNSFYKVGVPPCKTSQFSALPDQDGRRLPQMIGERVHAADILGPDLRDIAEVGVVAEMIAGTEELLGRLAELDFVTVRVGRLESDDGGKLTRHARRFFTKQHGRPAQCFVIEAIFTQQCEVEHCPERRRPAGAGRNRLEIDERRMVGMTLPHRRAPIARFAQQQRQLGARV